MLVTFGSHSGHVSFPQSFLIGWGAMRGQIVAWARFVKSGFGPVQRASCSPPALGYIVTHVVRTVAILRGTRMGSDQRGAATSRLTGRVLRARRGDANAKTQTQTFILLVDDDPMDDDEALGWFSPSAVLLGRCQFEVEVPWTEALLYVERVRPGRERPSDLGFASSSDVPREVLEIGLFDVVGEDEFYRLLEVVEPSLRSRDLNGVAESLSAHLPASRIPALWATVTLMTDALAAASPPYPPGTDSFQYWSTALVWGPRDRYVAASQGLPVVVTDDEESFAEQLLEAPKLAYVISGGENRAFVRAGASRGSSQSPNVADPGPELVGVYFESDSPEGAFECAGFVLTRDRVGVEAVVRDFAERTASRLGGVLHGNPVWFEQGTASVFSGMEIISIGDSEPL